MNKKRLYGIVAICAALVVGIAAYLFVWLYSQRAIVTANAQGAKAKAIALAEQTLADGPKPEDWPVSVFIPATAIEHIAGHLVGSHFAVPVGPRPNDLPDGYALMSIDYFDVASEDGLLAVDLDVSATYVPEKTTPWWSKAKAGVRVRALLSPSREAVEDGRRLVYLRLAPLGVTPRLSMGPISSAEAKWASELVAAGIIQRFSEKLELPVEAFGASIEVNTALASESYSAFEKEGGYYLTTNMPGRTLSRPVQTDRMLLTQDGVWWVGGRTRQAKLEIPPTEDAVLRKWMAEHVARLAAKLSPYRQTGDEIRLRVPRDPFDQLTELLRHPELQAVDDAAAVVSSPAPYEVSIGSRLANGVLAKPSLMRDDLLGEISLTVSPGGEGFARGRIFLTPPDLRWTPGVGVAGNIALKAEAKADLHLHLATAFVGGGVGADVGLNGKTEISTPVALRLQTRNTPAGDAVVLQPEIACTRISIDINPDNPSPIQTGPWFSLAPPGLRMKRNIGSDRIAPTILFDSLPRELVFGTQDDLVGEVSKLTKPSVDIRLLPRSLVIDDSGLSISAGFEIGAHTLVDPNARAALRNALLEDGSATECQPKQEYELLLGPFAIGQNNDVIVFIAQAVRAGQHVAAETAKQVEALYQRPIETIAKFPDNAIREGRQGLKNAEDAAAKAAEDIRRAAEKAKDDLNNALERNGIGIRF